MDNDEQIDREEIAGEILSDYVSNYVVQQNIWQYVNNIWQTYEKEGVILTLSIEPGVILNDDNYDCLEKLRNDLLKDYGGALHVMKEQYGYCKNNKDQEILGVISFNVDINDNKLKTEIDTKILQSTEERQQAEKQWLQEIQQKKNQLLHMYRDQNELELLLEQIKKKVNKLSENDKN